MTDVEFVYEDDARVTARHVESGVASFGENEAEALRQLADALDSHFGRGDQTGNPTSRECPECHYHGLFRDDGGIACSNCGWRS